MRVKEVLALDKFAFQNNEAGDPKVKGLAISPGVYHGILEFPESEIKNAAKTISNVPLLTNHENLVENAVGRVEKGFKRKMENSEEYAAFYEGFIDSEEHALLRKINKGIVDSTSIGFMCDHICKICGEEYYSADCPHWPWDDGFGLEARNVEVLELSVVSIPADSNASISSTFSYDTIKDKYPKLAKAKQEFRKESKIEGNSSGEKTMDFEKEYKLKVDELATEKANHTAEIDQLKTEQKQEVDTLKESQEEKLASARQDNLNLEQENEALKTENTTLTEENTNLKESLNEIKEVELSEKRETVTKLNTELGAKLTEDEIVELSENGLDRYIEMFGNIAEQRPNIQQEFVATPKYGASKTEQNKKPAKEKLFAKIQELKQQ